MEVKIISGWSNPGGSTVAFINLCNLLNDNGIECSFYGPHDYHLNKCKSDKIQNFKLKEDINLIIHFFNPNWETRPPIKGKLIYSCHEKDVFPVKSFNYKIYDSIHYVSKPQMEWHNIDHPSFIIPNLLDELKPTKCKERIAGIIGSIDRNKQTHISIERAIQDGIKKIILFGNITDINYYREEVEPLMNKYFIGNPIFIEDKQSMYDMISDVYHSSISECLSYVKRECMSIGINFHGNESTNNEGYTNISNQEILEKWKKELEV